VGQADMFLGCRGWPPGVLKWARERRCPWNSLTCLYRCSGRAPGDAAVGAGARVPVGRGDVYDRRLWYLEVLKWAHEQGCPWSSSTCSHAARGGHMHLLQWARAHGCPWDSGTCTFAAMSGFLDMLTWARQHHCPWDERTCKHAVDGGHLEVLRWAREHGCPWWAKTRDAAVTKGYSDNLPPSV